jgi:type II secretory pathway pseudopilin PulG
MHTFFGTFRFTHRLRRRRPRPLIHRSAIGPRPHSIAHVGARPAVSQPRPGGQAGFMLIEVLISAMLVSLIAIATFTGFDAAGRTSADERAHAQATQLVQQDEERLRGLTTTTLAQLGSSTQLEGENGICVKEEASKKWVYCEGTSFSLQPYTGTVFTITSSARFVAASKETFTCEVVGGTADYIQTTSTATWPALKSRPAVSQSSIMSTPSTAALMVKVKNQNEEPVEGATVTVTVASGKLIQITAAAGCVIFGAMTPEKVKVAVSKSTWVDKAGKSPPAEKEVSVLAGSLSSSEFTIAQPGGIRVKFENNPPPPEVETDTFYAEQTGIPAPPDFVGGKAGTPAHEVELPGLFPFAEAKAPHTAEPYTVFAGDCSANNPAKVTENTEKLKAPTAAVEPNAVAKVTLEAPAVKVTVWQGESLAKKETELAKSTSAKIINPECSKTSAQNFKEVPFERNVVISAGKLEPKYQYQPYATKLELCVSALLLGEWYKNTFPISNTVKAGGGPFTLYLKEKSANYKKGKAELKC